MQISIWHLLSIRLTEIKKQPARTLSPVLLDRTSSPQQNAENHCLQSAQHLPHDTQSQICSCTGGSSDQPFTTTVIPTAASSTGMSGEEEPGRVILNSYEYEVFLATLSKVTG